MRSYFLRNSLLGGQQSELREVSYQAGGVQSVIRSMG